MVLVQNKYKNTLVGVLRTKITFVTHSSLSCYVTLRTQVIRLNSGNLGPQKTDSGVFTIIYRSSCSVWSVSGLTSTARFTTWHSGSSTACCSRPVGRACWLSWATGFPNLGQYNRRKPK